MANGVRSLGLCAPISVIQGRCQVVLGKMKEKKEKKKSKVQLVFICILCCLIAKHQSMQMVHCLNKIICPRGATGAMLWKKPRHKISVRLRCLHSTADFIDPPKQAPQSSPVGARCGMSFFLLELCFLFSPVTTVLYRRPTARRKQLQWVSTFSALLALCAGN